MASAPRAQKALKQVYELVNRRLRRELRNLESASALGSSSSDGASSSGVASRFNGSLRLDPWQFLENPNSALARKLVRTELLWHDEVLSDVGSEDSNQHDAWVRLKNKTLEK